MNPLKAIIKKNNLDTAIFSAYIVHAMNDKALRVNEELLTYQTHRLQNLILEMVECCEERKVYEAERFRIPYAELRCLGLFNGERYLTVKGMAERLDVAKSRVTKIVNGLQQKGLIEVVEDPKDSRVKLFSLTGAGRRKFEEVRTFQEQIHRDLLMQLGAEERKHVLSYLEVLRSAMEAVRERLV